MIETLHPRAQEHVDAYEAARLEEAELAGRIEALQQMLDQARQTARHLMRIETIDETVQTVAEQLWDDGEELSREGAEELRRQLISDIRHEG
jgi:DNA-binding FrmR family transcriptional regulator